MLHPCWCVFMGTQVSSWYEEEVSRLQVRGGEQSWVVHEGRAAARGQCRGVSQRAASQGTGVGRHVHGGLVAGRGAVAAELWCDVGLSLGNGLVRERLGLSGEGTGYSLNLRTEVDRGVGVKIWGLTTSHPLGWLR